MRKARLASNVVVEGSKMSLFPDLSRRTLWMRASINPLLAHIPYRWGFPLALHVRHKDVSATFRFPLDLLLFLQTRDLPEVTLPDLDPSHQLLLLPKNSPTCNHLGDDLLR